MGFLSKKKKEESQDFKAQKVESDKVSASTEDINIGGKVEVKPIEVVPSTADIVSGMSDVAYRALILDLLVECTQRLRGVDDETVGK